MGGGIAVRRRFDEFVQADEAGGADPVFGHQRLAQAVGDALHGPACRQIGAAASRIGNEQAKGFGRKGIRAFLRAGDRGRCHECQRRRHQSCGYRQSHVPLLCSFVDASFVDALRLCCGLRGDYRGNMVRMPACRWVSRRMAAATRLPVLTDAMGAASMPR